MKILSLQYLDKKDDRTIEPIHFQNLTLLVGASGVGKTQILNAIRSIQQIAGGESLNGIVWMISFSIGDDVYVWEGAFELQKKNLLRSLSKNGEETVESVNIAYEKMLVNDKVLIKREKTMLVFKGKKSGVPIKGNQSVLSLIPDPLIQKAEKEFKKIRYSNYTYSTQGFNLGEASSDQKLLKTYKGIEAIRNSTENISTKLLWAYRHKHEIFEDIQADFQAIFPQVLGLKVAPIEALKDADIPFFLKATPFIQFKEKSMKDWTPVTEMSAGMFRTLLHIMELYLSAEGTVVLIDEFENSLGVNCIDELTTEIKGAVHRIQFIITSHHPYIVNNISYHNWKIVTRNGFNVSTQNAKDFNFDKSKHSAFIQLINHPSYKTGRRQVQAFASFS